ncbi:MAG: Nif3-like dinuclear metal center hexameric protein [Planctomycetota bacterium]|jgi:dinuclear metal center YbgI/SA1388 family protein
MKIAGIVQALEEIAPPELAEDWDNVGLLVGNEGADVRKLMVCVDLTAQVLAEAVRTKAQMVLTHHPVIPKRVTRVTSRHAPLVYEAVRRGVAIYCMHTNFDAAANGTTAVLVDALGLKRARPLRPRVTVGQCKIVTFVPPDDLSRVSEAAFAAGAGQVGKYHDCAFFSHGIGAFCGGVGSHPAIGRTGEPEVTEEIRLEVIAPKAKASQVCSAITTAHSYETPAIDVYPLEDHIQGRGLCQVGELARPATVKTLITRVKKALGVSKALVAGRPGKTGGVKRANLVSTAACCAGSGKHFIRDAIAAGATFYLTGELGHHDAIMAGDAGMTVVVVGHGNSERAAMKRLSNRLGRMLPKVKIGFANSDRDPLEVV